MNFQALTLPPSLHVRPATRSDDDFISQLYKSTRTDLDLLNAKQDFIEHIKESQFQAQTLSYGETYPNAMTFVIEYHNERIGRIILDFGHNEILLVDISLLPKAQGKGLGSEVIKSFTYCAEQIHTPLRLSVMSDNQHAKHVYTKLGFVLDEQIPPRDYLVYYPSTQRIRVGA